MVRLSKGKIKSQIEDKLQGLFFETIGKSRSKQSFFGILSDILSPDERTMIGKRIAIYYLLIKNIDSQTICEALKVTRATIAKYRFSLEKSTGIVPILKKNLKKEKTLLFLGSFLNEVIQLTPYSNEPRKRVVRKIIENTRRVM